MNLIMPFFDIFFQKSMQNISTLAKIKPLTLADRVSNLCRKPKGRHFSRKPSQQRS